MNKLTPRAVAHLFGDLYRPTDLQLSHVSSKRWWCHPHSSHPSHFHRPRPRHKIDFHTERSQETFLVKSETHYGVSIECICICAMVKSSYIRDGHPTFNRNPYNGYINPYYWVDDHPLLYGNNGSLDPSTYIYIYIIYISIHYRYTNIWYTYRTRMTHILKDLTHKMEGQPTPQNRGQLGSRYIAWYRQILCTNSMKFHSSLGFGFRIKWHPWRSPNCQMKTSLTLKVTSFITSCIHI